MPDVVGTDVAESLGQQATVPLGVAGGRVLVQQLQHALFILLRVLPGAPRTRLILQTGDALLGVTLAPGADGRRALAQSRRDLLGLLAVGSREDDPGAQHKALLSCRGSHPSPEGGAIFIGERDGGRRSSHAPYRCYNA